MTAALIVAAFIAFLALAKRRRRIVGPRTRQPMGAGKLFVVIVLAIVFAPVAGCVMVGGGLATLATIGASR